MANYVKFYRGTPAAYNKLTEKNNDTLYFITQTGAARGTLYLGDTIISQDVSSLNQLNDIQLSEIIGNKQLLVYDNAQGKWINASITDVINVMQGASDTQAGTIGLVPAPDVGEQSYFLRGDGTWAKIENLETNSNVIELNVDNGVDHETAIAEKVTADNLTVSNGDIAIVKELIYGDKRQYTAYVYNNGWTAMDGNYNAENVYFDEDITITMQVGNATVTNGAGVIQSKGKNLKQVFESLYAKEDLTLGIDYPSVSLSLNVSSVDKEVGDTFSRPKATLKVSDIGSYEYGSLDSTGAEKAKAATGITFNKMKVGFGTDNTVTTNMNEISAGNYGVNQTVEYTATADNIPNLTVTDASQSYKFFGVCDHTASPYKPRTNLGNLIIEKDSKSTATNLIGTKSGDISNFETALGQIEAKTLTPTNATFTVTGYRKWFTYVGDNMETIDSDWIRTNCTDKGKGKKINQNTLNLSVTGGTKRVVIAIPSGKLTGTETTIADYTARVKSCIDVDGMQLDIFAAGKIPSSTIAVNDKAGNNPMDYIVYVYENANGLAATTLKFTIN